jgi:hypothetical protein
MCSSDSEGGRDPREREREKEREREREKVEPETFLRASTCLRGSRRRLKASGLRRCAPPQLDMPQLQYRVNSRRWSSDDTFAAPYVETVAMNMRASQRAISELVAFCFSTKCPARRSDKAARFERRVYTRHSG